MKHCRGWTRIPGGRALLITSGAVIAAVLSAGCTASPTATADSSTGARQTQPSPRTVSCTRRQLHAQYAGGGPAMGYLSAVIRFVNSGSTCRVSGWPQLTAISAAGAARPQLRRTDAAPAFTLGRIDGRPIVRLRPGQSAYLVIDGPDHARDGGPCPGFRRFIIRIPGIPRAFAVPAEAPGYAPRFPNCGTVGHSVLVPRHDIVATLRRPR